MDSLSTFGHDIDEVLLPTYKTYGSLLGVRSASINSTAKSTHRYGSSSRQMLDVYCRSASAPTPNNQLIVFLYGGGFALGDKALQQLPVVYGNVGYFFAETHGIETIVIDYRLISHGARFPSGGEDIETALRWVDDHYRGKEIFLLGTSAGAVHICTFLFCSQFKATKEKLLEGKRNKLAGAVLVGTPFDAVSATPEMLQRTAPYFGEDPQKKNPLPLLRREMCDGPLFLPKILVLDSELDPDIIKKHTQPFVQELRNSNTAEVEYHQIKGHNHFSPILALGTGILKEEEWANMVLSFFQSTRNSSDAYI